MTTWHPSTTCFLPPSPKPYGIPTIFLAGQDDQPPIVQVACLIRVPTEVIKTRTQTSTYGASAQSSFASARLVLVNDGWRGFYRGFWPTVMREVRLNSLHPSDVEH